MNSISCHERIVPKIKHLKNAARVNPKGTLRLGRYLDLDVPEDISPLHLAKLINWRLTRKDTKIGLYFR